MAEPQQLSRGKRADVAEIEQERSPFEQEIDVEPRVAKGRIDQLRAKGRSHGDGDSFWADSKMKCNT